MLNESRIWFNRYISVRLTYLDKKFEGYSSSVNIDIRIVVFS